MSENSSEKNITEQTGVSGAVSGRDPNADLDQDIYLPVKESFWRRAVNNLRSKKYAYLIYAFLVPVVINYMLYVSLEIHPFGNGSVLVLDLNGQYVYFYEALRNAVYGETSLLYSFCRSLGGEFLGTYAYYVASPFSYIVCLFPQDRILDALLCIFLLKTGISGLTMGYYLDRISSKANKISIVTFSILYSLSAYAIVQQHNSMWIDALMWLPLLTLGIEELILHKKYKLFVSMLALTLISNFYIGYMACIYTASYFFYYFFSRSENGKNNPMGEKKHFSRSFARIAGFSALAIGISMVIVASAYYSLQFGKNTFSNPDFSFSVRFDILDFFTKFLPGSYDTVRPEGLPFVYCGILTLFCVPMYFTAKKFSVREKAYSAGLLGFFILGFSINTLDMIWHGFQKPNWLNYRYSFMFCFILLVLAYKGYGEIRKASAKAIALTGAVFVLFTALVQKFSFHSYVARISGQTEFDQPLRDLETIWFAFICFIVFTIALIAAIQTRHRENTALVICVLVCIEAYANALSCCVAFGDDVIYSSYSSYNDFIQTVRPLTDEIVETDPSFYRFEKNVHRKYCDNMALNIRGITNSTSTLNKNTINFLAQIGYAGKSHWSKYLGGNPVSDSLIGIKYVIASEDDGTALYYDKTDMQTIIQNSTAYTAYRNPYALSLAYAVDGGIAEFDMEDYDSPMIRLNALVSAMAGSDKRYEIFKPLDYETSTTNITTSTIAGHYKYSPANADSSAIVTYSFRTEQDGEVFFYMPSDYAREVTLKVNGVSYGTFYASETTRILSLGEFDKGSSVSLAMTLSADVLYIKQNVDSLFYLDMDAFREAFEQLSAIQLDIDDDWTPSCLTGTLTTTADEQLIQTTLTYDKGWVITVDGQKVETEQTLGALAAFHVDNAGEHRIELKYRPVTFTLGLAISLISLVLFLVIVIFEKKLLAIINCIRRETDHDSPTGDKYTGDVCSAPADPADPFAFIDDGTPSDGKGTAPSARPADVPGTPEQKGTDTEINDNQ